MTAEQQARQKIDALLVACGWAVQNVGEANIHEARGVALREFPLDPGFGTADYLLYVDGKAAGVIEAKKEGATLTGVEVQSGRYAKGLPGSLPAWTRPLPFLYESTGTETHFTNGRDPEPRARNVFVFHRPDTLAGWLTPSPSGRESRGSSSSRVFTRCRARRWSPRSPGAACASSATSRWSSRLQAFIATRSRRTPSSDGGDEAAMNAGTFVRKLWIACNAANRLRASSAEA